MLWYVLGVALVIVTFDVTVAGLFSIPKDQRQPEGALNRYFSFGLSAERKLERLIGERGDEVVSVVKQGWISAQYRTPDETWYTSSDRVAVYGMSFTKRMAGALDQVGDADLGVIQRAGPAVPLSHSYAMMESDPYRSEATWVCVGVLSTSMPYLQAMSGLGYSFDSPTPCTFPRFVAEDGHLVRHDPVIVDRDVFIRAFRDRSELYQRHLEVLRAQDDYWNDWLYASSLADRSAFLCLWRRGYNEHWLSTRASAVYDPQAGYHADHPAMAAVPMMLRSMKEMADKDGQKLLILLLHARGEPGHLEAWLGPEMDALGVTWISSRALFDSMDAMNFQGDGHYTPENDRKLAEAVYRLIKRDETSSVD